MLTFLIDALATFRITRLLIEDEILRGPRMAILGKLEPEGFTQPGDESKLAYFLQCPWCMGMWIAVAVVGCRTFLPRKWHPLATALALSAAAGLISEH
jgi:hypothetical protein